MYGCPERSRLALAPQIGERVYKDAGPVGARRRRPTVAHRLQGQRDKVSHKDNGKHEEAMLREYAVACNGNWEQAKIRMDDAVSRGALTKKPTKPGYMYFEKSACVLEESEEEYTVGAEGSIQAEGCTLQKVLR